MNNDAATLAWVLIPPFLWLCAYVTAHGWFMAKRRVQG